MASTTSPSFLSVDNNDNNGVGGTKRKRRPAGTPDPDAEVVALSPRTLLESDRYVCEICGQGFQRDQNLQMHRRRHKVPWKLLKRCDTSTGTGAAATNTGALTSTVITKKRVYVCPEPSCLHHDPAHALGDLVGIKKHFRRKHSAHRQWACARCSKAYAVQSDYKAHLKTCGTRGHSCDCGRVFSRVESFIEHQDACNASRTRTAMAAEPPTPQQQQPPSGACFSRATSSPSPSSENTNLNTINSWVPSSLATTKVFPISGDLYRRRTNVELPLLPSSHTTIAHKQLSTSAVASRTSSDDQGNASTTLTLSLGPCWKSTKCNNFSPATTSGDKLDKETYEQQLRMATVEKRLADEARNQASRQINLAEQEFADAKRIRQQAQAELREAIALRDRAVKDISATVLEITCHACKQQFRACRLPAAVVSDENSLAASHVSSVVTEGEGDNDIRQQQLHQCSSNMRW